MVNVGESYPLQALAADGNPSLFPQARVYTAAGSLVATVNLAYLADGLYGVLYPFLTAGFFTVVYEFYDTPLHTTLAYYEKMTETIEVRATLPDQILDSILYNHLTAGSVGQALAIIKGLVQHNFRLDNQVYNSKGLLLTARLRIYKTRAEMADPDVSIPLETIDIVDTPKAVPDDDLSEIYESKGST